MSAPAVSAHELYRFFHTPDDERAALRGVSLRVEAGELIVIAGPSGSGKSTLLACIAGLDEPDAGQVEIAGERMTRRPEVQRAALRARRIGMLFQSTNLIAHLTVEQNVRAAQRIHKAAAPNVAAELLDRLGLESRRRAMPSALSGGESVRAGLAVALANAPDVVLADEPTGELDDSAALHVMALLRDQVAGGAAVIVVSHDPAVGALADRVVRLADGRLVDHTLDGDTDAVGVLR